MQPSDLETAERGREAGTLVNNPAFKAGIERLENDIIEAWRNSAPHERDARERLYLRLNALVSMRQEFRLMSEEGLLAERRAAAARKVP